MRHISGKPLRIGQRLPHHVGMFYALGYLLGCYGNYRRYVESALSDARIEQQLQVWAETEAA